MRDPCCEREEQISLLVSGALHLDEQKELEEHLTKCECCKEYLVGLQGDDRLFSGYTEHVKSSIDRTQDAILQALTEKASRKRAVAAPIYAISRRIRYAGAAVAAVVLAVIGLTLLLKTPLTLADVMEAVAAQKWVHVKYDNGREEWTSLEEGKTYYKGEDGYIYFMDQARNIRQSYWKGSSGVIYESQAVGYLDATQAKQELEELVEEGRITIEASKVIYETLYPDGQQAPPWTPQTPWEFVTGHYGAKGDSETVDGKQLVRFDTFVIDALSDQYIVVGQLWADPETRLPVSIRKKLGFARRKKQGREFINGVFDFPATGPASIYDLGVPRHVEIVRRSDKDTESPRVKQVIEAARQARENLPKRYRVVVWDNDRPSEIDVIYWDGAPVPPVNKEYSSDWRGVKIRAERYFNLIVFKKENLAYHLPLPATVEQVLEWTKTQTPVSIGISDGKKFYRKQGPFPKPFVNQEEPYVRVSAVTKWGGKPFNSSDWPYDYQWEYIKGRGLFLLESPPESSQSWIALGRSAGRIDYFVDPEHDYICANLIRWRKRSGNWVKEREYELSDFSQLPGGQWYARKRKLITFADPEKGINQGGANWNIDIKVLEPDEFPPDTFNGQKLLQTVSKIVTD